MQRVALGKGCLMSPQRRFDGSLLRRNLPRRTHDHGAKTGMRMAPRTPTDGLAALALNRRRRAKIRNGAARTQRHRYPRRRPNLGAKIIFGDFEISGRDFWGTRVAILTLPPRVCVLYRAPPAAGLRHRHAAAACTAAGPARMHTTRMHPHVHRRSSARASLHASIGGCCP